MLKLNTSNILSSSLADFSIAHSPRSWCPAFSLQVLPLIKCFHWCCFYLFLIYSRTTPTHGWRASNNDEDMDRLLKATTTRGLCCFFQGLVILHHSTKKPAEPKTTSTTLRRGTVAQRNCSFETLSSWSDFCIFLERLGGSLTCLVGQSKSKQPESRGTWHTQTHVSYSIRLSMCMHIPIC